MVLGHRRCEMSSGARSSLLALALVGGMAAFAQPSTRAAAQCEERAAEQSLRRTAIKSVVPVYPESAIKSGVTGLVVAEVCVPKDGGAPSVEILESPNHAIGQAVEDALKQWRFYTTYEKGNPSHTFSVASRVVFYFVNHGGSWKVLSPADTFYVGPHFARSQ